MKSVVNTIILLLLFCGAINAKPASNSVDTLRINFNQFTGSGFSTDTTGGRLDSRLWVIQGLSDGNTHFGGSYLSGDYARGTSTGRVSTGGVYAFRVNDSTKVLGFQSTGTDLMPGSVIYKTAINGLGGGSYLGIEYDIFVMNDQGRGTAIDLSWSIDALNWVLLENYRFTTPTTADETPTWNKTRISAHIVDSTVAQNDTIYFRWTMADAGGTGSRDEWGLTNIAVFLTDDTGPPQNEPLHILARWDFDDDTDLPHPISIDNSDAYFGIVGARRSGYAAGFYGRAANANQWNNPGNNYWYALVSTVGYDSIHVTSSHYSSSTGPSKFIFEWSIDSTTWNRAAVDEISVGSTFQKMSALGIALPEETSDTSQLWLRWLKSSNLAVNGQELGSSGTSRIDEITIEGRFAGSRLPFSPAPIISLSNDEYFADVIISTTGSSIIDSSFLRCDQIDTDSTFSISFTSVLRQQARLALPELPRPSTWNCRIVLSSQAGEFISVVSEIIVHPPPSSFAEKPDLAATDIKLLSRAENSLRISWTPGSGEYRIVLIKPSSESVCFAEKSNTYQYQPNPSYSDTTSGGCKVVYNGSGAMAQIIGLNPLQEIHVSVVEYNGEPGRENYLNDEIPQETFLTRSIPPEALEELEVLQVLSDQAYLNWIIPNSGYVHIVAADSGWFTPERMLAFDVDEYQDFDIDGAIEICDGFAPCVIKREHVEGKIIYGWVVDGPMGHKSAQKEKPSQINIDWPSKEGFLSLATWSFNSESMLADQSIWEYRDSKVDLIGARHRGYITGFEGRAVNSDQWDNGANAKGWSISLSTMSLSDLILSFRILSSATGPAHFRLSCQIDGIDQEYFSDSIIISRSTWTLSGLHAVAIPSECLGYPNVDLLLMMADNVSVNGNIVSRTGTSRIDDVRISGQFGHLQDPILEIPEVLRNTDSELVIHTRIAAGAGHIPIGRYVQIESDYDSIRIDLNPLSAFTNTTLVNDARKANIYRVYHCLDISLNIVCSESVTFKTPYPIPKGPAFIEVVSNEPDSTTLYVYPSDIDSWVLVSSIHQSMPIAIDSVGIVMPTQNDVIVSQRLSSGLPQVLSGLSPGNTYRVWTMSINGDSAMMRFSRPPHLYTDIRIPDLLAPVVDIDSTRIVSISPEKVKLQWFISDTIKVLVSISEINSPIELPEQNSVYRSNTMYGKGDAIQKYTFVVGNGIMNSIRIDNLPLGRTWRLLLVAYSELNGSVTYAIDKAVIFTFDSMIDPLAQSLSAREIVHLTDSSVVNVVGSMLWAGDDFGILHTNDGNIRVRRNPNGTHPFSIGDSIALRGIHINGEVKADYVIQLGSSTHEINPVSIKSSDMISNAVREKYISLRNLLVDSHGQTSDINLTQRGLKRRAVHVTSTSGTLNSIITITENAVEFGLMGIPLVERTDSILHVFVHDLTHFVDYPQVRVLKETPNKGQLITWSSATADTILFNWKYELGYRPYDNFPDSALSRLHFVSRTTGSNPIIVFSQLVSSPEFRVSAKELHRFHVGADSSRTYVEIEWTLIPSEILENGLAQLSDFESEWYSFQLVRLQAVSIGDLLDLPTEFALSDPWPNPFNPATTIRIDVPGSGDLNVSVYDITGRLVSQLRSGNANVGIHFITWDAARIASGIYVITTDYKNRRYSKLVTLIK